jgi:hypothetical protein
VNAYVANANSLLGVCVHIQEGEKETEVKPVVSNDVDLDTQIQAVEESNIQQSPHSPIKVSRDKPLKTANFVIVSPVQPFVIFVLLSHPAFLMFFKYFGNF